MCRVIVFLIVAFGFIAGAAAQDVIILDSNRDLSADLSLSSDYGDCGDGTPSVSFSTEEPGFWHQFMHAQISPPDFEWLHIVADGVQYSEITEDGVTMHGYLDYDVDYDCGEPHNYDGSLQSELRTRILVTAPITLVLSGDFGVQLQNTWGDYIYMEASAHILIDKLAAPIVYEDYIPLYLEGGSGTELLHEQPLSAVLDLTPGIYDISIAMEILVPMNYGYGMQQQLAELSHVLQMEYLPQAAPPSCEFTDSDNDGDIDVRDFYFFQQCFSGPNP